MLSHRIVSSKDLKITICKKNDLIYYTTVNHFISYSIIVEQSRELNSALLEFLLIIKTNINLFNLYE